MKNLTGLLCLIFSVFITSCKKDETDIISGGKYASLEEFYATHGAKEQVFTISGSTGGVIFGENGTKITFEPNSFVDSNGDLVTGTVTIILKEVLDLETMILSHMHTTSNGQPLITGGEFYLKAYSGSQELRMAPDKIYSAEVPEDAVLLTDMRAYIGVEDSLNRINWLQGDSTINLDSSYYGMYADGYATLYTQVTGYIYSSNWLGWANCDHPYFNVPSTTVKGKPTDDTYEFGMDVYLVFENTLIDLYYDASTDDFPYFYAPESYDGTLVAIGIKDSLLYSSFVPFTNASNSTVEFTLESSTFEEFQDKLEDLE